MLGRQALAVALVAMIACPAWARPNSLGTVSGSAEASIAGVNLTPGSTIFDGDTVWVGQHGTASFLLSGGSHIQLDQNTSARLSRDGSGVGLELRSGRALFRSSPQGQVEGIVGDATFRPADGAAGVGLISFESSNTAILLAQQGNWVLSTEHDGKSQQVQQGQAFEVRLEAAPASNDAAPEETPQRTRRRRGGAYWTVLVGAMLIGAATAAALAAMNGESKLSNTTKSNAISPFLFE